MNHCCLSENDLTLLCCHYKLFSPCRRKQEKQALVSTQFAKLLIDNRKVRNYRNGWKGSPPSCGHTHTHTHTHTCEPRPTNRHGNYLIGIMFLALLQLRTKQAIHEMAATSVLEPVGLYSQNSCKLFWGQKYFYVSMQMPSSKGNTHTHKWIQVLS